MSNNSTLWTENHAQEAERRLYQLAADSVELPLKASRNLAYAALLPLSLTAFASALHSAGYDEKRVEKEVARVEALVSGHLRRMESFVYNVNDSQTLWEGMNRGFITLEDARQFRRKYCINPKTTIVRVRKRAVRVAT